jgi:hypothetical protein
LVKTGAATDLFEGIATPDTQRQKSLKEGGPPGSPFAFWALAAKPVRAIRAHRASCIPANSGKWPRNHAKGRKTRRKKISYDFSHFHTNEAESTIPFK